MIRARADKYRKNVALVLCSSLLVLAVTDGALGQHSDAPRGDTLALAPGISLGMTMRQAVRACRAHGGAVTFSYEDGESGQSASVPLGTPAPRGMSPSAFTCEGQVGELWVAVAPSKVTPRFVVTEARGYVRPTGLGMPAHEYARQLTQRFGQPTLEFRGGPRRPRRPTVQWTVPRVGSGQATLALTFIDPYNHRDAVSIGLELSPTHDASASADTADDSPGLRLLGVQLGAPASIGVCGNAETSVLLASGVPCFPREAELDGPWDVRNYRPSHEIFLGDSRASVRGVDLQIASLAAQHCPAWLAPECLLAVAVVGGQATGLGFRTVQLTEAQLREHVGQWLGTESGEPAETTEVQCRYEEDPYPPPVVATRRRWTHRGLSVEYTWPSGHTCEAGLVRIQTEALTRALSTAAAASP